MYPEIKLGEFKETHCTKHDACCLETDDLCSNKLHGTVWRHKANRFSMSIVRVVVYVFGQTLLKEKKMCVFLGQKC